jgi:hypothetical protein
MRRDESGVSTAWKFRIILKDVQPWSRALLVLRWIDIIAGPWGETRILILIILPLTLCILGAVVVGFGGDRFDSF